MTLRLAAAAETWPLADNFTISRGSKREAHVVVASISDGRHTGRGECVPYARYGESVESVLSQLAAASPLADREALRRTMPAGAARNALDCALWDLAAKSSGRSAADLAGLRDPGPVLTCYTLSLASPEQMAARARNVPHLPLLKLKLGGGEEDARRLRAVRAARPDARLVADANEAWSAGDLLPLMQAAAEVRVELIEQPLPAGQDEALLSVPHLVAICADESAHVCTDLAQLEGRYDAVNIKLDKAGGLTEALAMRTEARRLGLRIMVGCMVATSLAMAPALLLAQDADWVDLDGPLLLAGDRAPALDIRNGMIWPASRDLWG
ncbi:MAG TPA: N-acetyl-D-Glu racemase DgcA [Hyphomicrobiaceae bacterium]|nr:N-acetyl-D-Glu racemase DgcA [Hyphomicrobiaceae bacterium]